MAHRAQARRKAYLEEAASAHRDDVDEAEGTIIIPKPSFWARHRRERFKDWETVRVYDELAGYPWSCRMPMKVLAAHLSSDCRYTQELGTARRMAYALYGTVAFLLTLAFCWALEWPLLWAFVVAALVAPAGILWGHVKGFKMFMLPPVWIVRRLHHQEEIEDGVYQVDYEHLPEIVAEVHTQGTGMPPEVAMAERLREAESALAASGSSGQGGQNGTTATITKTVSNLARAFTPRIWRAYMLYEFLKGRDVREEMRGPPGTDDKIQKISMAGMALGSIGLLVAALFLLS